MLDRNKRLYVSLGAFVIGVLSLFAFQNCSKNSFVVRSNPDNTRLGSQDNFMVIEDGKLFTNKKVLSVKFQNLAGKYLKMRLSLVKEMNDAESPWVDYSAQTTFDLRANWSLDGAFDGTKKVYAELQEFSGEIVPLSSDIGLDTLPPQGHLLGILSKGLQGKQFSEGQKETISWDIADSASEAGFSSGFSSEGMTVSTTSVPDCSSSAVNVVLAKAPYASSYALSWPKKQPNEAFYICVVVADNAGNKLSLMSQPMISLWRVFAGDNTQGNGGSINSQNVRFQSPALLAKNSKNETYIYDSQFNNIRKVDENGIISLVAGDGRAANITVNVDAQVSSLNNINSMEFDSNDNLYVGNLQGVFKLVKADQLFKWESRITNANCKNSIDILKIPLQEDQLYLHSACSSRTEVPASSALAYISKFNLVILDASPLAANQLAAYRILGNGKISSRKTVTTKGFVATVSSDEADFRQSVDYPGALSALENGDLLVNPIGQYSNDTDGRSLLTYYKKISETQFEKYELGMSHVASQMDFAKYKKDNQDYIAAFVGRADRPVNLVTFKQADFTDIKMQVISPTKAGSTTNPWILGVLINERDENQPYGVKSLTLTATALSQVFGVSSLFEVKTVWGRDYTTEKSSVATEMFLPNPTGITQTKDGMTYVFDRFNSTIYRVDGNGQMTSFLGSPAKVAEKTFSSTDFKDVTFNSIVHPNEEFDLFADEVGEVRLFLSIGGYYFANKSINVFNLQTQKAQSMLVSTQRSYSNLSSWGASEAHVTPSGKILIARFYLDTNSANGTAPTSLIAEMTSQTAQSIVVGQQSPPISAPLSNMSLKGQSYASITAMTSHLFNDGGIASELLIFQNSTAGKLQLGMANMSDLSAPYKVIATTGLGVTLRSLKVMQIEGARYLIASSFDSLMVAEVPANFYNISSPALAFKKVCLPGTYFNNAKYTALTSANNLLISDVNSGRVLEYYFQDKFGKKMLIYSDDPTCTGL